MKVRNFLVSFVFALIATAMFSLTVSAQGKVVVTGNTASFENDPAGGWMFNRDPDNDTPFNFTDDQQSIGNGSLYVQPIGSTPADKFIAELFFYQPVSMLNSFSFDYMLGSGGDAVTDADEVYLNVYAVYPSSNNPYKYYDCRYDIVATTASLTQFQTFTFDPTQTYPVATKSGSAACPSIPANMPAGSTIRAFAINFGSTSASDLGLDGYIDNVVVNQDSGITVYDFEALAAPIHQSPANGSTVTTSQQQLINWYDVVGATSYLYTASYSSATNPDGSFVSPIYGPASVPTSEIATPNTPPGTYYWQVAGVDANGNVGSWSTPWSIIVTADPPPPPVYTTPTNKDQCKNGGWMTFNPAAGPYKNQGDCIKFFNTGK